MKKSDVNMETMMEEEYSELDDTAEEEYSEPGNFVDEEEYGESDYLADQAEHHGGEKMPIGVVIAGTGAVLVGVCIIIAFQKRKRR